MLHARRLGVAVAAGSAAAGCAWLCKPGTTIQHTSAGPPQALVAGQPLLSTLHSKSWVSSDTVRLRFELPTPAHALGLPVPGHVMVVDAATNYRPYSPISIDRNAKGFFELLVRKYPQGQFSSQLARMEPGDQATFFGPVASRFEYRRGATPQIGLVAAGTGITPMWQVIQAALADSTDTTRLSLVYASKSPSSILLKGELDRAAAEHPDRLRICFLVSQPDPAPSGGTRMVEWEALPAGVQLGRIDEHVLRAHLPAAPDSARTERLEDACHVLVCGPDSMIRDLCGPRARDGGVQPGPGGAMQARHPAIGGVLRNLGYRSSQVTWL
eukprot:jgi/Chrpa1/6442/Chrysochromulina_OHIO_Genome00013814-RA